MKVLLKAGADVHALDRHGTTGKEFATYNGHNDVLDVIEASCKAMREQVGADCAVPADASRIVPCIAPPGENNASRHLPACLRP